MLSDASPPKRSRRKDAPNHTLHERCHRLTLTADDDAEEAALARLWRHLFLRATSGPVDAAADLNAMLDAVGAGK